MSEARAIVQGAQSVTGSEQCQVCIAAHGNGTACGGARVPATLPAHPLARQSGRPFLSSHDHDSHISHVCMHNIEHDSKKHLPTTRAPKVCQAMLASNDVRKARPDLHPMIRSCLRNARPCLQHVHALLPSVTVSQARIPRMPAQTTFVCRANVARNIYKRRCPTSAHHAPIDNCKHNLLRAKSECFDRMLPFSAVLFKTACAHRIRALCRALWMLDTVLCTVCDAEARA